MARLCTIEGCGFPHYGLGFCNRHRLRLVRYGDPLGSAPKPIVRALIIKDDYALVPLTQGMFATIDLIDVERVGQLNWHAVADNRTFYALSGEKVGLHNFIAGHKDGHIVDHEDGDGLNNRRSNLRHATHAQNQFNKCINKNNTSGFKGVSYAAHAPGVKKWRAAITCNRQYISLGYHLTPELAAAAYDGAAERLFGEFARKNLKVVGG